MADHDELRTKALEQMEQLLNAATTLLRDLEQHEAVCRRIIGAVRAGEPLGTVLEAAHSDKLRPQLTDTLNDYERHRHRARLRMIALGVSEGMTTADIQRHWAITRQLASRARREIETLD
jgi:hypothetical protein